MPRTKMLPLLRKLQQVGADGEGFGCTLTASIARIQVGTPLLGTPLLGTAK